MTPEEDIEGLAGEYVLGSLTPEERREVAARRGRDRALDRAIADWERRLAPLADLIPGEEPPQQLHALILRRILAAPQAANVFSMQHALVRWRRLAVGACALAAILAVAVILVLQFLPTASPALVVVLQRSAAGQTADESGEAKGPPAFVVAIDPKLKNIVVTPVAARPVPRRSYQLWLVQPNARPIALGIVAPAVATTLSWPSAANAEQLPPAVFSNATLAISLEPEGGSAAGAPTGPILYEGKPAAVGNR